MSKMPVSKARLVLLFFALPAAMMLLFSCASVPSKDPEARSRLFSFVNCGNPDQLAELSTSPFLFDSEILVLGKDKLLLWSSLREGGFGIPGYTIEEVLDITEESYKLFGSSMDVEVFFNKYVGPNGALVRINSEKGDYLFILDSNGGALPLIAGMKGPLQ